MKNVIVSKKLNVIQDNTDMILCKISLERIKAMVFTYVAPTYFISIR